MLLEGTRQGIRSSTVLSQLIVLLSFPFRPPKQDFGLSLLSVMPCYVMFTGHIWKLIARAVDPTNDQGTALLPFFALTYPFTFTFSLASLLSSPLGLFD